MWKQEVVYGTDNKTMCIMDVRLLIGSAGYFPDICPFKTEFVIEGLDFDMQNGIVFYRSGTTIYRHGLVNSTSDVLVETGVQITGW